MRRIGAILFASLLMLLSLVGCSGEPQQAKFVDGQYYAEFKEYDSYGYKDYLHITVEDGVATQVKYNGVSESGGLKTDDEKYQSGMEQIKGTYPARYTTDLANQLLEYGSVDKIDTVAGATWSSECFKALYNALATTNMVTGDTSTLLVDHVPEK